MTLFQRKLTLIGAGLSLLLMLAASVAMASGVATTTTAQKFLSVVASVPANCAFPLYAEDEVEVTYGINNLVAVLNTDYTVTLSAPDYDQFTVTPTAALITKINDLIAEDDDEVNYIVVRRKLDFLTSASPSAVNSTTFLARELERLHMGLLQVNEKLFRAVVLPPSLVGGEGDNIIIDTPVPGGLLYWNDDGTKLISGDVVSGISGASAAATAAAASASAASASATAASGSATSAAGSVVAAQAIVDGFVPGSGTVTNVATGAGLTGGPITGTGTIAFATIADDRILANVSGGALAPAATTLTSILDNMVGTTQGAIVYRNATVWAILAPGTSGDVLTSQGAGANLAWTTPASSGVIDVQQFDTAGANTWTKPGGGGSNAVAHLECWGGGGGGGGNTGGGGGGGGSYKDRWVPLASLGATETVTVGAGGAGGNAANGGSGVTSTFGAFLSAYGGAGGQLAGTSGSAGGWFSTPAVGATSNDTTGEGWLGANGYFTGGGGGNTAGGKSVYGGGGGGKGTGVGTAAGGTSVYGGAGGAGNSGAGTAPGGGGGGVWSSNPAGAGGKGRCIATVFG